MSESFDSTRSSYLAACLILAIRPVLIFLLLSQYVKSLVNFFTKCNNYRKQVMRLALQMLLVGLHCSVSIVIIASAPNLSKILQYLGIRSRNSDTV